MTTFEKKVLAARRAHFKFCTYNKNNRGPRTDPCGTNIIIC